MESERLRLLAIIEANSLTGPAKNLLDFAAQSRGRGVETHIATFIRSSSANLFTETVNQLGIPLHTIAESGPYDSRVKQTLRELTARVQPDIVQTHAVKSHFLLRSSGAAASTPWAAFHHGYTWPTLRARMYNQLDRWSLRGSQKVLTVSLPFRDELIARGVARARIEVIHNSIRPDWASDRSGSAQLRANLRIPAGRSIILIVGRLSLEKDHSTLLRALAPLPNAHLLIVGEGPERPRIEREIRSLGLQDRVTLAGQQPSAELYYTIADIAVLSSRSEGSPNALLEAMAAGVPVVATRVGGVPEIVADGESALLVPPADVARLSAALRRLLSEPGLVAGLTRRSRELILNRHSPETRATRLMGIYRGLVKTGC